MIPRHRLVFFDVDSTLVTIEGIDVLANGDARVASLTSAAMEGEIPIDEVYALRLEMIRPSRDSLQALGRQYVESLVAGADETFRELRAAGTEIHLVTAGLAPAIAPLAQQLGVSPRAVHAVNIDFAPSGEFVDFDRRSLLTRAGGKEVVVRDIRARSHGRAVFIGDGMSDLETRPAVDLFIGFGGVRERARVKENADVYVSEPDLRAILPYLLAE